MIFNSESCFRGTALQRYNGSGDLAVAWERPQDSYKLFYERGFEIPEPAGGGSLFDSALLGRQECIRIEALGTPEIVGSEREPQGRIPELGLGSFSIKKNKFISSMNLSALNPT